MVSVALAESDHNHYESFNNVKNWTQTDCAGSCTGFLIQTQSTACLKILPQTLAS